MDTDPNRKPYKGEIYVAGLIAAARLIPEEAATFKTVRRITRECCRPGESGPVMMHEIVEMGLPSEECAVNARERMFVQIDSPTCKLVIVLVDWAAPSAAMALMEAGRASKPALLVMSNQAEGHYALCSLPGKHEMVVFDPRKESWEAHLAQDIKAALEKLLPEKAAA